MLHDDGVEVFDHGETERAIRTGDFGLESLIGIKITRASHEKRLIARAKVDLGAYSRRAIGLVNDAGRWRSVGQLDAKVLITVDEVYVFCIPRRVPVGPDLQPVGAGNAASSHVDG